MAFQIHSLSRSLDRMKKKSKNKSVSTEEKEKEAPCRAVACSSPLLHRAAPCLCLGMSCNLEVETIILGPLEKVESRKTKTAESSECSPNR